MAVRLPLLIIGKQEEFKHEWIEPYSYCGVAPNNTPVSSPFWTISRIEDLLDGTTIIKSAIGAWDNKENLIYE